MRDSYGYMGKILRIDLSNRTHRVDSLDVDATRKYVGGRGLGIWLLAKEIGPSVAPYAEENALIFMTGPYTGTGVFSAFYNVTTKSPLTGLAAASHSGGSWGPSLKKAGYDGLIITGKADRPCYLVIEDGSCRILDASDLWGLGIKGTTAAIADRHGRLGVAAIGPAGENLVRYASIMNDVHRAAGRSGVGAVMGSKMLKAVAVGGRQKVEYSDEKRFLELSRRASRQAKKNGAAFAKYGTSMVLALMNEAGALPTNYFQKGHFEHARDINGDTMKSRFWIKDKGCFKCPLRCANIHSVPDGPFAVEETEGPEYETMMAFGSNCGNSNLECLMKANDLCNDLGMDTIAAGACVALMFYLFEKGIAKTDIVDGMDLHWGNPETIVGLLSMAAYRRGFGDVLAEGSVNIARYFGEEAAKLVIEAKMLDFPAYEPRRANGMGLSFATSNRGACHLRGAMYVHEIFTHEVNPHGFGPEKVNLLINKENFLSLIDSLVMCKFGQRQGEFTIDVLSEVLRTLTGTEYTANELLAVGERIYNLERIYNHAAGKGPDALPERLFEEDLEDGLEGGKRMDRTEFEEAVTLYYRNRKWGETGRPTLEKLNEVGLDEFGSLTEAP